MHKIVLPSLAKRFGAAFTDVCLFLFLLLGVFAAVQAIYVATPFGTYLRDSIIALEMGSGLYYEKEGEVLPYDNLANWKAYDERVYEFYIVNLKELDPENEAWEGYDTYWYNTHILGLEDIKGLYPNLALEEPYSKGATYFEYREEGVDVLGWPKAEFYVNGVRDPNNLVKNMKDNEAKNLYEYYFDKTGMRRSVYYDALDTLHSLGEFRFLTTEYNGFNASYPLAVSFPIAYALYYVVPPLFLRGRATFGKRFFSLEVISLLNFESTRGQALLRSVPQLLAMELLLIFLPRFSTIVIFGGLLVSYLLSLFTKDHRASHDYIAMTKVIDGKESLVYKTVADQELGEKEFKALLSSAEGKLALGKETLEKEKRDRR